MGKKEQFICIIVPPLRHQQHPPAPALEDIQVLLDHVPLSPLDLVRQPLQPLRDRPGHPQGHLVLEDVQDGEYDRSDRRELAPAVADRVEDPRH